MHRLQPLQGLQIKLFAAHQQVAAFNQSQTQVTREVGVLKIGFVVRPGCQKHDAAVGHGAQGLHAVDQ